MPRGLRLGGCLQQSSRFAAAAAAEVLQDGTKRALRQRPRVWSENKRTLSKFIPSAGRREAQVAGGTGPIPRRAPQPWVVPRRTWCWVNISGSSWCVHGAAAARSWRARARAPGPRGAACSVLRCLSTRRAPPPPRQAASSAVAAQQRSLSKAGERGASLGRGRPAVFRLTRAPRLQIGSFAAFLFGFGALSRPCGVWQRAGRRSPCGRNGSLGLENLYGRAPPPR